MVSTKIWSALLVALGVVDVVGRIIGVRNEGREGLIGQRSSVPANVR